MTLQTLEQIIQNGLKRGSIVEISEIEYKKYCAAKAETNAMTRFSYETYRILKRSQLYDFKFYYNTVTKQPLFLYYVKDDEPWRRYL